MVNMEKKSYQFIIQAWENYVRNIKISVDDKVKNENSDYSFLSDQNLCKEI